jgi:hypothetical protein
MVHLLFLRVAQSSAVLVVFFFFLMIIVIVMVVVLIVMVIIVAIVLRQLLSFCHCFLSVFSCRYHDHDLKRILLLRNILRRVMLRLLVR